MAPARGYWTRPRRLTSPATVRTLRLVSGIVLFVYVLTHLGNHALGLVSLWAMEWGRGWFLAVWRSPLGTVALYGAFGVHIALGLLSLYRRRHLRMPVWEALQIALGLVIPPLLFSHVVGTRLAASLLGVNDTYSRVMLIFWELSPDVGAKQLVLMSVAWTHGCMGMHYWLRLRGWYPRVSGVLSALALLVPVLAALGFVQGGREAAAQARDPARQVAMLWSIRAPLSDGERAALASVTEAAMALYGGLLCLVLAARGARALVQRRGATIRLAYPGGRTVVVPAGLSVLEASRLAGIPHASVCGGRGRCSTCRVLVDGPPEALRPPSEAELRVLRRVGAPVGVRLACQLRPAGDLSVTPLLPATATASDGAAAHDPHNGREREIAVLFADLRRFTAIAERKLPYDVVFLLNRYFETVGGAIQHAGGVVNQFTGDGVMALFGVDVGAEEACRRALNAAREMVRSVATLSEALGAELPAPLRIGIGIHAGFAVVGRMGYAESQYLTAVGDTVHVASRLEQLTKEYDCQLVISDTVAHRAGVDVSAFPGYALTLRNRAEPLAIRVIADVTLLPAPGERVSRLAPSQ